VRVLARWLYCSSWAGCLRDGGPTIANVFPKCSDVTFLNRAGIRSLLDAALGFAALACRRSDRPAGSPLPGSFVVMVGVFSA
jgi:hypothetical protein